MPQHSWWSSPRHEVTGRNLQECMLACDGETAPKKKSERGDGLKSNFSLRAPDAAHE